MLSAQDQAYVQNALSGQLQHLVLAKPMPKDFLNKYCTQCHGDQKADRRFDMLSQSIGDFREQELWQEIVDQLNLGEMPPDDEKQPSEEERLGVVGIITQGIAKSREKFAGKGSHTVLRRLNKFEYSNTVSDLLGLNTESWNPAADFPADVIVDGFDNDGAELVTSGLLLEKYFPAAESAIVRATQLRQISRNAKPIYKNRPFISEGRSPRVCPSFFRLTVIASFRKPLIPICTGGFIGAGTWVFYPCIERVGVPHSGRYTIRVKAGAVNRNSWLWKDSR